MRKAARPRPRPRQDRHDRQLAPPLSGFVGDRYGFSILENGSPVHTLTLAAVARSLRASVLARHVASAGPS